MKTCEYCDEPAVQVVYSRIVTRAERIGDSGHPALEISSEDHGQATYLCDTHELIAKQPLDPDAVRNCPHCPGSGRDPDAGRCPSCAGAGEVSV